MFFGKKNKKDSPECNSCASSVDKRYSYCPFCGESMLSPEEELADFGMLGKSDKRGDIANNTMAGMGITDKIVMSLVNNLMKNLDKQFRDMDRPEKAMPQGIKISIGMPQNKKKVHQTKLAKRNISEEQIKRMSTLPRTVAKTNIRRLSDKIIYELSAPGIQSPHDIFISKLESGYEIKAIGDDKVYVNSLPLNLPLKGLAITQDKLLVEFMMQ